MTGEKYCSLYKKSPDIAFRAIFDEYLNYVYTIIYNKLRSCGSAEDIEECVGDTFADIYMKYDTENVFSGELKSYISTVAKRKAINRYHSIMSEKRHIADMEEENMSLIASDSDIEKDSDMSELRNIMLGKINELGEPDSTIIIQKFYYNRSSSEIAEIVSMSAANVRMRCKRAMTRLRSMLEAVGITI